MPSVIIFYHFFYPDDVAGSLHMNGLAQGLSQRGWDVEAVPCNRGCRDQTKTYPRTGTFGNIKISRVWRPPFDQSNTGLSRIINAIWMIASWSLKAFRSKPDVIVIGTDPILSILLAVPWKIIRPNTVIAHWCYDLYPEGAVADGIIKSGSVFEKCIKYFCGMAYRRCDLLVDLGDCMRSRLHEYPGVNKVKCTTIVPWALTEPESALQTDDAERRNIGNSKLVLMYSGNLGRFHSYDNILKLARELRGKDIKFVFSVRGNAVENLKAEISPDDENILFVEFAPLEKLQQRLSAADIHIVSLRSEWNGLAIPSKFFGAIAAGRPVLFSGSPDCAVAKWINEYHLGWVLEDDNVKEIAGNITGFYHNINNLKKMFPHCHETYRRHFSEEHLNNRWDEHLRKLL